MAASLGSLVRRFTYKPEFDPKTGLNKRLLKKVEDHLRKHPDSYDQSVYCAHVHGEPGEDDDYEYNEIDTVGAFEQFRSGPMCGTAACVAGWAVLLSGKPMTYQWDNSGRKASRAIDWEISGREALGIDEDLASWLFDASRSESKMPDILAAIRKGTLNIHELAKIERQ